MVPEVIAALLSGPGRRIHIGLLAPEPVHLGRAQRPSATASGYLNTV
ncbi:MAG: hypothetical protein OXH85_11695 [Truepera sp.]|nr:hypothetical protein [Truepera sp.]